MDLRRWTAGAMLAIGATSACGGGDGSRGSVGAAAEAPTCQRVGNGDGTVVSVTLDEWRVDAAPASVPAGTVTFEVRNEGGEPHELVVVRAGSMSELTVVEGRVDEDALAPGAFVGEFEAFGAGQTCGGTFELSAGGYVLSCNLAEAEDGAVESHVEEGMATTFLLT